MRDNGIRYGLQTRCEGGGLANATILELLVTKPGTYGLSVDGTPLALKEAKPLPASD